MQSLLGLPVELVENIFQCADEKSLLALRQVFTFVFIITIVMCNINNACFQVSKFTKELAEATILNRRENRVIDQIKLTREVRLKIDKLSKLRKLINETFQVDGKFTVGFNFRNADLHSKLFLVSAIAYAQIPAILYDPEVIVLTKITRNNNKRTIENNLFREYTAIWLKQNRLTSSIN